MSRLLVPIGLDAFVVRPGEAPAAAVTSWTDPTRPAAGRERQSLAPEPFADDPAPRPVGVHLHWAMPDALAVLRTDGKFPALPCRWLVVRLDGPATAGTGTSGPTTGRRLTAWLLPNVHAATPQVIPDGHLTVQPIGSATPALTVRGRGGDGPHPSWALSYDQTLNRLAFHDPVDAPADGPLTYLVVGWYTHPRLDPLTPPDGVSPTPTWLQDTLAALRWRADLPAGTAVPTGVLLHGAAVGIGWPGTGWPGDDGGRLSDPGTGAPKPADVRTALGDTLAAAVGALLDGRADEATATLTEAALTGAVAALNEPDGVARLETTLHTGRFVALGSSGAVQDAVWAEAPAAAGTDPTGTLTTVSYPQPRTWRPVDPVVALAGLGRTLRHGADGRFDPDGLLPCRLPGGTLHGDAPLAWTAADDVPAEVGDLVQEAAVLDPAGVSGLAAGDPAAVATALARASWWDAWAGDWHALPAGSGWTGTPPCPLAVTRPGRPWNPLRLDWQVAWRDVPVDAFVLGERDFDPGSSFAALAGTARALTGSGWLTSAPASLLAGAARTAGVTAGAALALADTVSASFEGLLDRVRGTPTGTWVGPSGVVDEPPAATLAAEVYSAVPVAAGSWSLVALRAVDTFGQVLDLSATSPAWPDALDAPGGGLLARPRFTAPAQLTARFLAADPAVDLEAAPGRSPLAGFVLPAPGGTEIVGPEGASHGMLRPDPYAYRTTLAATPTSTPAPPGLLPLLAQLVTGADVLRSPSGPDENALAALLRVVAVTRNSVDVTGRAGDGQLAMLLGAPVAVLRLGVTLEVDDPQSDLTALRVPVRLGDLGLLNDGVLGWVALDDPTRLHPVHTAVVGLAGSSGTGTDVDPLLAGPLLWLQPGVRREVALLSVPATDVSLTSGLLPAKRLEMPREWTDGALRALTPTIAVDALVHDPAVVALPTPTGVRGEWTWHTRPAAGRPWQGAAVSATPPSAQPGTAVLVEDGYLRVTLIPDEPGATVTLEVTGILRGGPTWSIRTLSGTNPDGTGWRLPIERAVEMTESGRFSFVAVSPNGERSGVLEVGVSPRGAKFLHTPFDRTTRNNLEELPPCPPLKGG